MLDTFMNFDIAKIQMYHALYGDLISKHLNQTLSV